MSRSDSRRFWGSEVRRRPPPGRRAHRHVAMAVQSNRGRGRRYRWCSLSAACCQSRYLLTVSLSGLDALSGVVAGCATAPAALQHGSSRHGHCASRHRDRCPAGHRARSYRPASEGLSSAGARRARPASAVHRWVGVDVPRKQPRVVAALSGHDLLSAWTYSLPAAIVVLSLVFYPVSMLATEVAMRRIDGRLEEAALMVAPPSRVLSAYHAAACRPRRVRGGTRDLRARRLGVRCSRTCCGSACTRPKSSRHSQRSTISPARLCSPCRFCCSASSSRRRRRAAR